MFKLETNFNENKIHQYIEKRIEQRIAEIIEFLRVKGIEYTTKARTKVLAENPYTNRTFNLVSSVGFAIVRKSVVLESYFPLLKTGTEGQKKGELTAEKAAKDYSGSDDVALVLVAGEDYASYVQDNHDFDVTKMASIAFANNLRSLWRGKE
ncbi:hypothetical protein WAE58_21775 [Pedobacter panaciterrae]|uniref:Uncharacterized protein n=1 Tax=Pedobacter panaciterrae TaxID=363849 RepID=A0ABU8NS51_9SPHI